MCVPGHVLFGRRLGSAPRTGNGQLVVVVKVDLHHADQQRLAKLEPGFRIPVK